jgi:hypothetical protein
MEKRSDTIEYMLMTADMTAIACMIWLPLYVSIGRWMEAAAVLVLGVASVCYLVYHGERVPGKAFLRAWRKYL